MINDGLCNKYVMSESGLGRWCVLQLDLFEIFFEFILPYIIQLAHAIDLSQRELGLAQVMQAGLAVVLRHVLIGRWQFVIKF